MVSIAAEDDASGDAAARAAVEDIAADEDSGGEDKREPSLWTRPQDRHGGRRLRGRNRTRRTSPPWTQQLDAQTVVRGDVAVYKAAGGGGGGVAGPAAADEATGWLRRTSPLRMRLCWGEEGERTAATVDKNT